jgi:hypothetical protein
MRKEVLVAILIGFGIGLVVTLGIFTARRALKSGGQTEQQPQPSFSPTPQVEKEQTGVENKIAVTSPNNGAVETTEKITLTGTTTPGSTVTIWGGETDIIVAGDEKGQFSAEITLAGGDNEIKITSFSPTGETAETVVTVVYSTAEF